MLTRRSFFARLAAVVPYLALARVDAHAEGHAAIDALLEQWPTHAEGDVLSVHIYTDVWNQMHAALPDYMRWFVTGHLAKHFVLRQVPVFSGNCVSHILYRRRFDGQRVSRTVFVGPDPYAEALRHYMALNRGDSVAAVAAVQNTFPGVSFLLGA